ncbi:MAG TPA: glutaminyl-peptide cyclotransferase [Vicinamibacterales bacterium]|nr:glutaminyl-peptide cyclotransferase [Vicinamibacterales bacterium]
MTARHRPSRRTTPPPPGRRRAPKLWLVVVPVAAVAVAALMFVPSRPRPAIETPVAAVQQPEVPVHGYEVVHEYPHDAQAFTQGLIFRNGFLYESTGLEGMSTLRKVEIETGRVVQQRKLENRYFAEGLTEWGNELVQLTYTSKVGFVYDLATFEPKGTFEYTGQGWGLTHDGQRLIMSDGNRDGELRFLDPVTRREQGRITVRDRGRPVADLNELEFVQGQLYANVWHTDRIAVIRLDTGDVSAWIDLAGLKPASAQSSEAVLNGIAYDAARDRLFVTGKWWPRLYEIRVRPRK